MKKWNFKLKNHQNKDKVKSEPYATIITNLNFNSNLFYVLTVHLNKNKIATRNQ